MFSLLVWTGATSNLSTSTSSSMLFSFRGGSSSVSIRSLSELAIPAFKQSLAKGKWRRRCATRDNPKYAQLSRGSICRGCNLQLRRWIWFGWWLRWWRWMGWWWRIQRIIWIRLCWFWCSSRQRPAEESPYTSSIAFSNSPPFTKLYLSASFAVAIPDHLIQGNGFLPYLLFNCLIYMQKCCHGSSWLKPSY